MPVNPHFAELHKCMFLYHHVSDVFLFILETFFIIFHTQQESNVFQYNRFTKKTWCLSIRMTNKSGGFAQYENYKSSFREFSDFFCRIIWDWVNLNYNKGLMGCHSIRLTNSGCILFKQSNKKMCTSRVVHSTKIFL